MNTIDAPTTTLEFPATWRKESRDRFQLWADMGRVDQVEVDRVEE